MIKNNNAFAQKCIFAYGAGMSEPVDSRHMQVGQSGFSGHMSMQSLNDASSNFPLRTVSYLLLLSVSQLTGVNMKREATPANPLH